MISEGWPQQGWRLVYSHASNWRWGQSDDLRRGREKAENHVIEIFRKDIKARVIGYVRLIFWEEVGEIFIEEGDRSGESQRIIWNYIMLSFDRGVWSIDLKSKILLIHLPGRHLHGNLALYYVHGT